MSGDLQILNNWAGDLKILNNWDATFVHPVLSYLNSFLPTPSPYHLLPSLSSSFFSSLTTISFHFRVFEAFSGSVGFWRRSSGFSLETTFRARLRALLWAPAFFTQKTSFRPSKWRFSSFLASFSRLCCTHSFILFSILFVTATSVMLYHCLDRYMYSLSWLMKKYNSFCLIYRVKLCWLFLFIASSSMQNIYMRRNY